MTRSDVIEVKITTICNARNIEALEHDGWKVLVVWECQTRTAEALEASVEELISRRHEGSVTAR